jgi:Asp-tRNA(Asn)/Glu-tRNA(Gln) amidotransferase A subunit family amidase
MGLLDAAKAERIWSQVYSSFQNLFKKIDLLIAPGNATSPFLIEDGIPHEVDGQPLRNYVDASLIRSIITLSGHPVIAIPCGRDHLGLPFGIQVVGRRHGDKALLEAAVKMQRHFQLELKTKQPKPNIEDILKW